MNVEKFRLHNESESVFNIRQFLEDWHDMVAAYASNMTFGNTTQDGKVAES